MNKKKKISQDDIITWQDYIKNPNDIVDKEKSIKQSNADKLRFRYDLHGYTLETANKKSKEIILFCVKENYKEILLITGKGIHSNTDNDIYVSKNLSKLKHSVPEYVKSDSDISKYILSIASADQKDGGEGAIIIKLRKL
ncbi:Smr/MutS family protein [Candidatus Pelagibacter bacterium]|nr:Smr/MutS family protein [Candidatus Pelagibacter bacterium]MDA9624947.1 Smr/MutS family protein [Candidatus Pelagibacter bacterium]